MNVALFRAFPDPYRLSMARYAADLERRVGMFLKAGEAIHSECLPNPHIHGTWTRYWDQYVKYGRYAKAHAADVNHILDHGYGHLTADLPAGRTIVSFHDAVVMKVPGASWRTKMSLRRSLRAMQQAAAIVCPSAAGKRDLLELQPLPEQRIHVIPLGIDERFRPPADRDAVRDRLGMTGTVVLMVGHTQPYMNVDGMLRVVAAARTRHGLDLRIVKIGLTFTPAQERVIAELGLSDAVRLVGRVAEDELPAYYQSADVLLYAPHLAGFGLPPLEAMACGTPVVASNRGSIPEVVGDAAILADAADETALAQGLADVVTNPVRRRRLVEAGYARAAQYEWSRSAQRLLELYRRVHRG